MKRWMMFGLLVLIGLLVTASGSLLAAAENTREAADGGRAQLLAAFPANVTIELIDHAGSARTLQRVRIVDLTQVGGVTFLVVHTFEGMTSYVNMAEILRITSVRELATRRGSAPATASMPGYQVER
jgi:hypothetical protein